MESPENGSDSTCPSCGTVGVEEKPFPIFDCFIICSLRQCPLPKQTIFGQLLTPPSSRETSMVSAITASMALVHETLRGGEGVWWEHTLVGFGNPSF